MVSKAFRLVVKKQLPEEDSGNWKLRLQNFWKPEKNTDIIRHNFFYGFTDIGENFQGFIGHFQRDTTVPSIFCSQKLLYGHMERYLMHVILMIYFLT